MVEHVWIGTFPPLPNSIVKRTRILDSIYYGADVANPTLKLPFGNEPQGWWHWTVRWWKCPQWLEKVVVIPFDFWSLVAPWKVRSTCWLLENGVSHVVYFVPVLKLEGSQEACTRNLIWEYHTEALELNRTKRSQWSGSIRSACNFGAQNYDFVLDLLEGLVASRVQPELELFNGHKKEISS